MTTIYHFFGEWKDLFAHAYSAYPLAAAITTLAALGLFFYWDRLRLNWLPRSRPHPIIAVIAWAIIVPILGFLFQVIEKVWTGIVGVSSVLSHLSTFVYDVYDRHPILILVLLVISGTLFFIWNFVRPENPSRAFKVIACIALFLLSVAISAPIANMFASR